MGFTIVTLGGSQLTTATGVPIAAVQITTGDLNLAVSTDNPLAVTEIFGPSGIEPVLGALNALNAVSPLAFTPLAGRPFNLTLTFSNDANGITAQLFKSYDAGVTLVPLLSDGVPDGTFQQSGAQPFVETEAGVDYFLKLTEWVAGSVAYRFSQ